MNREILFRGKRTDNGEWIYGSLEVNPETGKYSIFAYSASKRCWFYMPVISETVGQYTGLTDKNGKKIFEGDIVQTAKYGKDSGSGRNFAGKDIFHIVFEDGGYCLRNEWRRFNLRPDTGIDIISTIHDNPELIGGVGNG